MRLADSYEEALELLNFGLEITEKINEGRFSDRGKMIGLRLRILSFIDSLFLYQVCIDYYTPVRNEPGLVLRYPFIRDRLSRYLYANYGHLKLKLFPKLQKNFRDI